MDESWRFRSSIPGDICPTCSTSHFPFCPPPPAFNRNGYPGEILRRYPPDVHPPFHRLLHDLPFPDHRPPPPFPMPAARGPEPWAVDLPLEREPLPPAFHPSQSYFLEESLERERESFRKRARIEDPSALGNFPPPQPFNRYDLAPSRIFSDDERRLSLIRDHGRQSAAPTLEDGVQDQHRNVGIDHSFLGPAARNGHAAPPDPVFTHQNHPVPANSFEGYRRFPQGPIYQSDDRFLPQERMDFHRKEFETSRSGAFSPHFGELRRQYDTTLQLSQGYRHGDPIESSENYMARAPQSYRHSDPIESAENYVARAPQSYRHGDPIESAENYVARAPQSYRHDDPIESAENYVARAPQSYRHDDPIESSENYMARAPQSYRHGDHTESSEKYAARAPEERSLYESRLPDSYPVTDYAPQGPYEKYHANDCQQLHLNENPSFVLPKQPQYPRIDDNLLLSNVENPSFVLPTQPQYPHIDDNPLLPNMVRHEQENNHLFHDTRLLIENRFELQRQHVEAMRSPLGPRPPIGEDIHKPFVSQPYPVMEQSVGRVISKQGGYLPIPGQMHNPQTYPPLPPQPLLAVHPEPPQSNFQVISLLPTAPLVPSPAPVSIPATMPLALNARTFSEPHLSPQADFYREPPVHASTGFTTEGLPVMHHTPPKQYAEDGGQTFPLKHPPKQYPEDGGQTFPLKHSLEDKPTIVDACHLFKQPHRASRPDHIVIILRGLPGSGKSYLAKALRDIEVESGGNAPRIHAMDDYFMIEVEKVEDNDGSKSSSSFRGKKQITKKVIEYCYEPEMEEAYRSSMLKAFKKTLDEGIFTFIIVDDRNLRVADFAQFWAIAKGSGYEVYLLEATYKDPAGCAARNVHGFTLDDIKKMAEQWEEAPSLYLQLDIQSLFHGDDLNEHSIKEVDMDTDDAAYEEEEMHQMQDGEGLKMTGSISLDYALDDGLVKVGDRWDTEEDEELTGVKELERSKWSKDLDEYVENTDGAKENSNALSGLMQAYGKGEKSVHWGDRVDKSGFSIGAVKKKNISSLIIGPGSGYNLNSNPLLGEEDAVDASGRSNINESKRRFHEQLRAERESFKAVFDRRRLRIGGLFDAEDE